MAESCDHNCSNCSANCGSRENALPKYEASKTSKIKKIIGVSSGKGGVGKSFITSNLAIALQKKGYKCGIIDADILGPSIPKSFGIVNDGVQVTDDRLIIPKVTELGIKVISTNLLLPSDTEPVIYRGSLLISILQQFFTDVDWGELDYLFIDMPPGTGDVPLTIYQSFPIDGVIIVSTPQSLVSMIVEKSINMCKKMNIRILGLIENMSYVECPECKTKIEIFGKSNIDEVGKEYSLEVLAKVPQKVEYVEFVDSGNIEKINLEEINKATSVLENLLKA